MSWIHDELYRYVSGLGNAITVTPEMDPADAVIFQVRQVLAAVVHRDTFWGGRRDELRGNHIANLKAALEKHDKAISERNRKANEEERREQEDQRIRGLARVTAESVVAAEVSKTCRRKRGRK